MGAGSLCPASAWENLLRQTDVGLFFVSVFSFHTQRDMCFNDGSNINDPETQTAVVGADRVDMEM